ncbi:unnamed protein product, partial [Medioppia subpectinata]
MTRNFGAITCEPCKGFFRKNALKNKPKCCPSNGKCIINTLTRKMCNKCRLNKCFAVGMKKELILNTEEKERRKQIKIERQMKLKQNYNNFESNPEITSTIAENNAEIGLKCNHKNQSYKQNSSQELTIIPISSGLTDYNGLKQLEINRISELMRASVVFNYPLNINGLTYKMDDLEEVMKYFSLMNETMITNIIGFTKCLSGFDNICADDRLALIKYNTRDLIAVCTLQYFDRETNNSGDHTTRTTTYQFYDTEYKYIKQHFGPLMHEEYHSLVIVFLTFGYP